MKTKERIERGQLLRERVTVLHLSNGLPIKACAYELGIGEKTAGYHWGEAKKIIRASARKG